MSVDHSPVSIRTDRFTIEGWSRAGNETWFRIRELGIAFDIGRSPEAVIPVRNVLVTHSHIDHSFGIPFYAAQRRLRGMAAGNVYVPREKVSEFEELVALHERLSETDFPVTFVGVGPGDSFELRRGLRGYVHRSTHRVVANGYEVVEVRHKLKSEWASRTSADLAAARHEGREVTEEQQCSLVYYTGDTDRRLLEESTRMFSPEVLIIECSFAREDDYDRAARYTHIHFDDIAEFAGKFENHLIVLTHFSLRYSPQEIHETISRRCPAVLRDRIRLALPEPFVRIEN